ncbi:MAG TPA: hypothetical protein VK907_04685, partial [Phnomibacter sp.]|nr:hypothetical protein [Phnomibacter sp.]
VRDIEIHPTTHDLVLGTHGRGIIVVDDIRPIRGMTEATAQQPVVLFPMGTVKLSTGRFGGSGFPAGGAWNGGNPPAIPAFEYYLKDRVMSGEVKIDILDADGKLVNTMPGTKRKGINRVYWNQRMKPPKTAEGGVKLDFSAFTAPMVMPGSYTVKLSVSGKEYTQPLTLVHDDKGSMTLAERKAQYEASMTLYGMQEELAQLVDTLTKTQTALKPAIETATNKKIRQQAKEFHDKAEALRAQLMATKNKSIFADEKRFKEELSELYAAVAANEQAPSNLQLQRLQLAQQELANYKNEWAKLLSKYKPVMTAGL